MNFPKISIVIPSFNQGDFIERTLLSILKQDYSGEVEIIVSDGGSKDNTVEILKKYQKYLTWWSEKDSGYADAVNKGFAIATGDIFAIQSSDDYYLKDSFSKMISEFIKKPDAVLICGREAIQEPDGYVFGGYELPELITPRSFLLDYPFPGIFQHTTFFRRKFYETTGGVRSQFDMCADADLYYRMLHFGDGHFLNEYIAVYQRHDAQRTRTQIEKFEAQLLNLPVDCKRNPLYNSLWSIPDKDYSIFSDFIKLFYLQYANKEKAQNRAKEIIKSSNIDQRTMALVNQILAKREVRQNDTLPEKVKKKSRKILNLFKRYIEGNKSKYIEKENILFRDVIKADWWQKRGEC